MDPIELLKRFEEYFDKYESKLYEDLAHKKDFVSLPFFKLAKFDPLLVDELLDKPDNTLRAMAQALESKVDKSNIKFLIEDLPQTTNVLIRNLRSTHLDKLWTITGTVKRKTDVRPKITTAKFQCPSCGNVLTVLQIDKTFKEPKRCSCGRNGHFQKQDQELMDAYSLVIEELTEYIKAGSELKRLNCFVGGVLSKPEFEQRIFPGVKVKLVGILKPMFVDSSKGGKKTQLDIFFDVNNIEILEEDYEDININQEDKEEFQEMVKTGDVMTILIKSLFAEVEGYETVKKGIVLMMVGGEQKIMPSGFKARGDIHSLLIGNPGCGKSTIAKLVYNNSPKARYVSGKGASGVGLTASVVRDELMGGYALEAGALPLTHHGVCVVDEFDKLAENETDAIHEALEEQEVSISKASIQATLRCETTLLAAANPKFGRFDPSIGIYSQINLPPPLITRFDLIFFFDDQPDEEKDKKVAKKLLSRYRLVKEPMMSKQKLKKFFAYTKQFHPTLGQKEEDIIVDFYVKIRNPNTRRDEGAAVPISPRYIEVVRRLSEAHAKLHLRERIFPEDIQVAVDLVLYYLRKIAINPETGQLDIDMVDTGYSATNRSKRNKFLKVIEALSEEAKKTKGTIPHERIVDEGVMIGIEKQDCEEMISKMLRNGELYEPTPGFYQKI